MKRDWLKLFQFFVIASGSSIIGSDQLTPLANAIIAALVAGFSAIKALDSSPNKREDKPVGIRILEDNKI